ncbi:MAG: right-handed parallel beta-helix repeat-containing protein [Candidatus Bathyarchaeia archaeon]
MKRYLSHLIFALLIINALAIIGFNVKPSKGWTGTVYIRADGSIDPPDAPIITYDNITYNLTDNIKSAGDGIIVDRDNIIIDGKGFLVEGQRTYKSSGIKLSNRFNITIQNIRIEAFFFGIWLIDSRNNYICANDIAANDWDGVYLYSSYNNNVYRNNITENGNTGIALHASYNNNIYANNITANGYNGIYLYESYNNNIYGNNLMANGLDGILLDNWSYDNNIYGNNITVNSYGIEFYGSHNNNIYHNNFVNNSRQVFSYYGFVNVWDDGYPSGGNYWSDYTGVDVKSGPSQDLPGSDGIGDTPYIIDAINKDRYPLMYPYVTPPSYFLTITTTAGGTTDPAPGTYTYINGSVVSVTAIPYVNYRFEYWMLDGANVGSTNPIEVLMDSNHTLEAVFTQITYQLTISTTTGGTTNPTPGTYTYVNGTVISVTAIPEESYVLGYWELDGVNVGSENPINVLMTANHTLHAVFLQVFQLTVTSTSGGTTNPSPGTYSYAAGMELNVTAIPNPGYSFAYWLLDGQKRTENPITIIMDANYTLEAYFVDDIPPQISDPSQNPPPENVQPYQDVTVTVTVTDYGSGVKNVTLWYSTDNGTTWTTLNMTELLANTYQATIPGYGNCTWVTYKIIAYDNTENMAVKDNNGYNYQYHVIPEIPSTTLLLAILTLTTLIAIIWKTKRKHQLTHFSFNHR